MEIVMNRMHAKRKNEDPVSKKMMNRLTAMGIETVEAFFAASGFNYPETSYARLRDFGMKKDSNVSHLLDLIAEVGYMECLMPMWYDRRVLEAFLVKLASDE